MRSRLDLQRASSFSYESPGLTRELSGTNRHPPGRYDLDHCRVQLGNGGDLFAAACRAIDHWRMFDIGWVEFCWPNLPVAVDEVVGVMVRPCGLWSLNVCRIVFVIDERESARPAPRRYGFAYGTLPDHVEAGEERFTIEWRADDTVWYELLAVSRPAHWLARLAYPLVRRWQAAFRRDSSAAMLRAVQQFTAEASQPDEERQT